MAAKWDPIVPDGMLAGKVVLIGGASQGIGEAAAFGFARAGATVLLRARREERVDQRAEAISAFGGTALGLSLDVADEASQRAFVERSMNEFGRIDGAFNNAGIDQKPAPPHEIDFEEWRRGFAAKADGTFLGIKSQPPAMLEGGGGSIVNHGSAVGEKGVAMLAAPCASQAAIVGLTRAAAKAYAPKIRINMLATGAIDTAERMSAGQYADVGSRVPIQRPGRSEEVAAVAAWLLSDFSSYQTGATVPVDGGYVA